MTINPVAIIHEFYPPDSRACNILLTHSRLVTQKAVDTAVRMQHLNPDMQFIQEAGMLHDIGIFMTDAPAIGCTGDSPYICHGFLGRELLEKKGLPDHALICERHVGVGITAHEIKSRDLPIPERNMIPVSIEEKIICYADKFFSKHPDRLTTEKSVETIMENLGKYGDDKVVTFKEWAEHFS